MLKIYGMYVSLSLFNFHGLDFCSGKFNIVMFSIEHILVKCYFKKLNIITQEINSY